MNEKSFQSFFQKLDEQGKDVIHIATLFGDGFNLNNLLDLIDIKPSKLLEIIDIMLNHGMIKNNSDSIKGPFSFIKKDFFSTLPALLKADNFKSNIFKLADYLEGHLPPQENTALNLANLYMQIEPKEKGFFYIKKAADLMVSLHKPEEALSLYENLILHLLNETGEEFKSNFLIDSLISFILLAVYIKSSFTIKSIIEKVRKLPIYSNNKSARSILDLGFGIFLLRQGLVSEGSNYCLEGWKLSKEINNIEIQEVATQLLGLSYFYSGRITEAIQIYEGSVGNLSNLTFSFPLSLSYLTLSWCYGISGRTSLGLRLAESVSEHSKNKSFLFTESYAQGIISLIYLETRKLNEAENHLTIALKIADRIKSNYLLYLFKPCQGYLEYSKGQLDNAVDFILEGLSYLKDCLPLQYPYPFLIEILAALQKNNVLLKTEYSSQFEIGKLVHSSNILIQGTALRYQTLSDFSLPADFTEMESLLKRSYNLLYKAGAAIEKGKTLVELSKLYIESNLPVKAKTFAKMAYDTLSKIDTSLFPSQLSKILPKKSKELRKDHGLSDLLTAIEYFPDSHKYFSKIISILSDMFGAERSAFFLKNKLKAAKSFDIIASHNLLSEEIDQFKKNDVQLLLLNAVNNKDVITVFDQEENIIFPKLNKYNIFPRSLVLIPLVAENEIDGIIYLDNKILSGRLSKNDLILLKSINNQIAIALKSFDLHVKINTVEEDNLNDADPKQEYKTPIPAIMEKSHKLISIFNNLKKIAPTDTTVLISGETGVGKELFAKAVHQFSKRSEGPLIIVNLSALTPSLVESELFGYEKGAFTGAVSSKPGRFEIAHGGTIFLDEIGDLSFDVQVKLLRVLQERSFERVGSNRSIFSDFRVIAATNKDLHKLVERGDFRSDLFYRINTFPIEIPPLRERKEDIPSLALHFLNKYSKRYKKDIKNIKPDDIEKLLAYSWPGNVRELENIIEKNVILNESSNLCIGDLIKSKFSIPTENDKSETLLTLKEIERDHILKILNHTKWRVRGETGAAKILGLKPSTLEFKIKKLGIK